MKLIIVVILFLCFPNSFGTSDTIKPNQTLQDNGQTLLSAAGVFELGFFTTENSNKRYVGIWFKKIPDFTVIWIANRNNPITDASSSGTGLFALTETGDIQILSNETASPIWSSNSSAKNPTLQLLDSGNLVLKDETSGNINWQSFDQPLDTLIAGMKLGRDLRTGQEWILRSRASFEDPSNGNYTYENDPRLPEAMKRRNSEIQFRTGAWDGSQFGGDPPFQENPVFKPIFVFNETHVYYEFENIDNLSITRFWVSPLGGLELVRWNQALGQWLATFKLQKDECDNFSMCGPNGVCHNSFSPAACRCLEGFVPRAPRDWARFEWGGGCVLRRGLNCSDADADGFKKLARVKLPYGSEFSVNGTVRENEGCEAICRRNCSCVAYALSPISGCVVWFSDLLDVRVYNVGGQDLYVRMSASEFESDNKGKRTVVMIISVLLVTGFFLIFILVGRYIIRKRISLFHLSQDKAILDDIELPSLGLDIINDATNNFSSINKIGEGGFGSVYKGILRNGQEIAVKRLSKDSGQGLVEFKNEIILIAKLQHRNLVRLLGCCIHKEERMLIYEYMPNKSLDLYIFGQTRGNEIDWQMRFDIILGIARGLLYLHQDSRLRIIHRDLKASNILLDQEMNPKISDFGLARIFSGEQTEIKTKRVIGTYGYMSPEYSIDGKFSIKSDIFSFGVIVLEIVSGKKNRGFEHPDHDLNLLGHAWKLWNESRSMELIDVMIDNVCMSEALRCIQVGLLCVQKRPEDRPLMSSVLYMLDKENSCMPQPKHPGFYVERVSIETALSLNESIPMSSEITITMLQGR